MTVTPWRFRLKPSTSADETSVADYLDAETARASSGSANLACVAARLDVDRA
jgi:hypothetical protein